MAGKVSGRWGLALSDCGSIESVSTFLSAHTDAGLSRSARKVVISWKISEKVP